MMYSLYYKHPESGVMYPCTSTRMMDFSMDPEAEPVLLAQATNVEKALRSYKASINQYHDTGYLHYLAGFYGGPTLIGADTLDNFVIVPMEVSPKFDKGYVYRSSCTQT